MLSKLDADERDDLGDTGPLRVDEVGVGLGFEEGDDGDELGGEGGGALEDGTEESESELRSLSSSSSSNRDF